MTTAPHGQADMTRPPRPVPLICALFMAPIAALLYGMASGTAGTAEGGLYGVAFFVALFAIRFNWARITTVVLLGWLSVNWFMPALAVVGSDDDRVDMDRVSYAIIAGVLTVAGVVLLFIPTSNIYYARARVWREGRRAARRQVQS